MARWGKIAVQKNLRFSKPDNHCSEKNSFPIKRQFDKVVYKKKVRFTIPQRVNYTQSMKFGYARVSTRDQNLNMQIDDLLKDGCEKIFQEAASGANVIRPELDKLLEQTRRGDVIVIWKLDRLGRSLKHLVALISALLDKGIGLKSLNDPIDTTSSQGRLIFNIFASLAEFERDVIIERTQAGLKAARARGRRGGRPKGLTDAAKRKAVAAKALYNDGVLSVNEIASNLGISKGTLYSYLRHERVEVGSFRNQEKSSHKFV